MIFVTIYDTNTHDTDPAICELNMKELPAVGDSITFLGESYTVSSREFNITKVDAFNTKRLKSECVLFVERGR